MPAQYRYEGDTGSGVAEDSSNESGTDGGRLSGANDSSTTSARSARLPPDDQLDARRNDNGGTLRLDYLDQQQTLGIEGFYNLDTGDLALFDVKTGNTYVGKYKSGTEGAWRGAAPIPPGDYAVLDQGQRDSFLRLEPFDEHFGNDKVESTRQSELRLHGPGDSWGCVTSTDSPEKWAETYDVIRSNQSGTMQVEKTFTAQLGDFKHGREVRDHEYVKYFGTLRVFRD